MECGCEEIRGDQWPMDDHLGCRGRHSLKPIEASNGISAITAIIANRLGLSLIDTMVAIIPILLPISVHSIFTSLHFPLSSHNLSFLRVQTFLSPFLMFVSFDTLFAYKEIVNFWVSSYDKWSFPVYG